LPDVTPCDFYVWGMLSDTVYGNSPCTEVSLKESVQNAVFLASPVELVMNIACVRYGVSLRAVWSHFQHFKYGDWL
jgi:hypothetical protein